MLSINLDGEAERYLVEILKEEKITVTGQSEVSVEKLGC